MVKKIFSLSRVGARARGGRRRRPGLRSAAIDTTSRMAYDAKEVGPAWRSCGARRPRSASQHGARGRPFPRSAAGRQAARSWAVRAIQPRTRAAFNPEENTMIPGQALNLGPVTDAWPAAIPFAGHATVAARATPTGAQPIPWWALALLALVPGVISGYGGVAARAMIGGFHD
jgi:hypothetical protein